MFQGQEESVEMKKPWDMFDPAGDPAAWDFRVDLFFEIIKSDTNDKLNLWGYMPSIVNDAGRGKRGAEDADGISLALPNANQNRANPFGEIVIKPAQQQYFDRWKRRIYMCIHTIFGGHLRKDDNFGEGNWETQDIPDFFRHMIKPTTPPDFALINTIYDSFSFPQKLMGQGSHPFIFTPLTGQSQTTKYNRFKDLERPNFTNIYTQLVSDNVTREVAWRVWKQPRWRNPQRPASGVSAGANEFMPWRKKTRMPKGFAKLIKAYIFLVCMGEYRGSMLRYRASGGTYKGGPVNGEETLSLPESGRNWLKYRGVRSIPEAQVRFFKKLQDQGIITIGKPVPVLNQREAIYPSIGGSESQSPELADEELDALKHRSWMTGIGYVTKKKGPETGQGFWKAQQQTSERGPPRRGRPGPLKMKVIGSFYQTEAEAITALEKAGGYYFDKSASPVPYRGVDKVKGTYESGAVLKKPWRARFSQAGAPGVTLQTFVGMYATAKEAYEGIMEYKGKYILAKEKHAPSPSPSAIPPDLAGLLGSLSQPSPHPGDPSLSRTVTISASKSKSKSPAPALQMPEKKRSKIPPNFDQLPEPAEASEAAEAAAVEAEPVAEASEHGELQCDAKEQEDNPACRPTGEPALNQAEAEQIAERGDIDEITARILGAQALDAQTLPITVPPPGNWWMAIAIAGAMLGVVYLLEDNPGGGMPLVGAY